MNDVNEWSLIKGRFSRWNQLKINFFFTASCTFGLYDGTVLRTSPCVYFFLFCLSHFHSRQCLPTTTTRKIFPCVFTFITVRLRCIAFIASFRFYPSYTSFDHTDSSIDVETYSSNKVESPCASSGEDRLSCLFRYTRKYCPRLVSQAKSGALLLRCVQNHQRMCKKINRCLF